MNAYKCKAKQKNVAAGIKKENLLLANYSHFNPPLQESKKVARVFRIYFKSNMLKNDTRELAPNVTTAYKFLSRPNVGNV